MGGKIQMRRALLSSSDKEGLAEFAAMLHRRGVELVSTGGTASVLRGAGLPVMEVSDLTGHPEMLDGRVKTLHPAIHGAILADLARPAHSEALGSAGMVPIDLVSVGLYPFEDAVRSGAPEEDCIEQIDVGGPAMIRAAAKNHARVVVVTRPDQYADLERELDEHDGATTLRFRQDLAAEAFGHTASYDAAVAEWAHGRTGGNWPSRLVLLAELDDTLRYGENPHQRAALYRSDWQPGALHARLVQGKPCSYNNIADADAALEGAAAFPASEGVACVIVKHTNPCGVAVRDSSVAAYEAARGADPESAFGGVVAFNALLDRDAAEAISSRFFEVLIAPRVSEEARCVLAARPALRVLEAGGMPDARESLRCVRSVAGGYLVQDADSAARQQPEFRVVSRRAPDPGERRDLEFAWRVVRQVKSNAIVLALDLATLGVGAGQMSRVDAVRAAVAKADANGVLGSAGQESCSAAVLASDAFFPFADGVEMAAKAGVRAIIQPGGSRRDKEVISAADAAGLSMLFTGMRHFRH